MKKGHFDSKKGGNVLSSKNWIGILRPAINEWRPKKFFQKIQRNGIRKQIFLICNWFYTKNFIFGTVGKPSLTSKNSHYHHTLWYKYKLVIHFFIGIQDFDDDS